MNSPINNLNTDQIPQSENSNNSIELAKLITENNETNLITNDDSKSEVNGNYQISSATLNSADLTYGSHMEKCGEIYVENGKYYLSCQFCTENHDNLDLFIAHISSEHLQLHSESDYSDNDSCCPSSSSDDEENSPINKIIKNEVDRNNYENLDILRISYGNHYENDYHDIEKPENISCEPDTGIFFNDLSENSMDHINYETSHMQFVNNDSTNWTNRKLIEPTGSNTNGNNVIPSIDGRYYCGYCDKSYSYSKSLKEHIDIIHKKSEKQFKCSTCDKAFSKQWKLNTHLKVHTDERPFLCSLCVMSFKWKKNLQRHLIRVHSVKYSDLIYEKSKEQNLTFGTSSSSNNTVRNSLTNQQQLQQQNNEQYPIIKNLLLTNNHSQSPISQSSSSSQLLHSIKLEKYDNDDELMINDDLTNCFDENSSIKIENNINNDDNNVDLFINNYNNDKIPNFLNEQSNLNNIKCNTSKISINNDGMFACKLCDKVYVRKDSLKSHEKIHTSGLICNICDKPFTHQFFLDRHMKTHKSLISNDKVYICEVCSDILPDESSLRRHIKYHFKKKYNCRCGQIFNIRKDYRSHRKICRTMDQQKLWIMN